MPQKLKTEPYTQGIMHCRHELSNGNSWEVPNMARCRCLCCPRTRIMRLGNRPKLTAPMERDETCRKAEKKGTMTSQRPETTNRTAAAPPGMQARAVNSPPQPPIVSRDASELARPAASVGRVPVSRCPVYAHNTSGWFYEPCKRSQQTAYTVKKELRISFDHLEIFKFL